MALGQIGYELRFARTVPQVHLRTMLVKHSRLAAIAMQHRSMCSLLLSDLTDQLAAVTASVKKKRGRRVIGKDADELLLQF